MSTTVSIGKLEFSSPINLERSCGLQRLADSAKSTTELFFDTADAYWGMIEWDVPQFEMTEHIGLVFDYVHGKRILTDYDGVFTLPDQAMELLERHNVDCAEMRRLLAD